jgi:hypothetical protein
MVIVLKLSLFFYEFQRLLISVDDCLLSHNVILPLTKIFHNEIKLFVIGGVFLESI